MRWRTEKVVSKAVLAEALRGRSVGDAREHCGVSESMHERYDRDERGLVLSAGHELWTDGLVDMAVDVSSPIFEAAQWRGIPEGKPALWVERATATNALSAIALRATRTVSLTIRAGYAPEALAGMRRLIEASGHAARVADDVSGGQYALNWLAGRGKSSKHRVAFGSERTDEPTWDLMSGQSHAVFAAYARFSARMGDDQVLIHSVGPHRDPFWDSIWMWVTARQFMGALACQLKGSPAYRPAKLLDPRNTGSGRRGAHRGRDGWTPGRGPHGLTDWSAPTLV